MARVLKPTHPLAVKIDELTAYLEKNDLMISRDYLGSLNIIDKKTNVCVRLSDIEDISMPVDTLPAEFDYKMIIVEE